MVKTIIVDDELGAIKSLKWELENFCADVTVCDSFTNPVDAISAINYLKPDCVFLDIEMPEMDGFQLLNSLKFRDFDLIITTAYDNYAIRAFKEQAVDYLLKPIDSDDLLKSVNRVKSRKNKNNLGFEVRKVLESIAPEGTHRKIALPLAGKTMFVDNHDIIYCKSSGNYTEIFFKKQKKQMLSKKLKEVEVIINNNLFFRVHNSYLVNINCIKEFVKRDGQYLIMEDQTSIPVSRAKRQLLLNKLNL